jgi:hypothetical protein
MFNSGLSNGKGTNRWNASVTVLTTTQALTKRSNVIPGGEPPPLVGAEAEETTYISRSEIKRTMLTVFLLDQS